MEALHPLPAAVLWDMDGTLIDSEPYWIAAETELAARFGVTWTHADGMAMVGNPLSVSGEELRSRGVDLPVDQIIDFLVTRVTAQVREMLPWQADAKALLDQVVAAGVPCALVTMSYTVLARAMLEQVPGVFDAVVTGDEDFPGKPDPAPYLVAAERLGVDIAQCVVLEDSPAGTGSGHASGALTVGVRREAPFPELPGMRVVDGLDGVTIEVLSGWLATRVTSPA